ncbi:MAG: hypothetical protein H6R09_452 [Proteobacteria bacterium]|nr:hypothetical protein [Pseudomonadota bacterium]
MRCQRSRAFSVRSTRQGTGAVLPLQRRSTVVSSCAAPACRGNSSGQSWSAATAAMKASLTSTDRLKCRSTAGSRLASTKVSMSGWSQRSVAIIAPRRAPVDSMVAHIASQMCMKETGPEAMLPVAAATMPAGRRVEKS